MRAFVTLAAAALVLTLGSAPAAAQVPGIDEADNPWMDRRDLTIGHRGARFYGPENTLYALQQGVDAGAQLLEFDLFASAEGEIVVIHDATVDRTTDGSGDVGGMTVDELKALDAGYWHLDGENERTDAAPAEYRYRGIATGDRPPPAGFTANDFTIPTLEEVLERFPDTWLLFEIKDFLPTETPPFAAAQRLAELLAEHGRDASNGIIASFDDRWIEVMQQLAPQMSFAPGLAEAAAIWGGFAQGGLPLPVDRYDILFLPDDLEGIIEPVDADSVAGANESGMAVHVFTVNDCHELEAMLDTGVHGIVTDTPSLLEEVYTWRGARDRPAGEIVDPCARAAVDRLAGADRIATASRISQAIFRAATTDTIVVARADEYADALAGVPLAAQEQAPILLTDPARLSEPVGVEAERLGAERAIVLGGTAAVSEDVVAELEAFGLDVERVSGHNRFATAAAVADRLGDWDSALVVEGDHPSPLSGWPDAVTAGPYAALRGSPILLATRDRLPTETADALDGAAEAVVVGGTGAVSAAVEAAVGERVGTVRRVSGSTRYDTSRLMAIETRALDGADQARVWLATGGNWPDALAVGPAAASTGAPLLLVHPHDLALSPSARDALAAWREDVRAVRLAGGTSAIAGSVEDQVVGVLARARP